MKTKVVFFDVVMIVLLLFVSAASAEIKARTFSFSPYIGGYTFSGNEDLKTRPVSGFRIGYDFTRRWGVEGAFDYLKTDFNRNTISTNVNVFGYRLEGLYHFLPDRRLVPFVALGLGGRSTNYKDIDGNRNNFLGDYGAGLKYFMFENLALRADIRHLILANDTLHNLEYTVGVTYYFGGPKPAPVAPPPPPPPPAPKARPALPAPLGLETTPQSPSQINVGWNTVSGASGYKIYRDGSYLTDSKTATVPDRGLQADTRYCYKVTAVDETGKESVMSNESCAKTPALPPPPPPPAPINLTAKPASESQIDLAWNAVKGATGYNIYRDGPYVAASAKANVPDQGLKASTKYCYQVTATDKGGRESAKSNEACATTPAPPVMMEEKKEAAVAKEMFEKGRATVNIEFDTNKANIKPKYHEEIKKFADVMKNYPDLKVVIEGHTDNMGGKAFNEKLSQRRAESVKKYLVDKFGIAADRLTAKGYGMSKPIAGNKTAADRAKNRRVEAVVDYVIKK